MLSLPRVISQLLVLVCLVAMTGAAVPAAAETVEGQLVDEAVQEALFSFQEAFALPSQFTGQVSVSVQGQASEPLSMELSGLLEVYDQDLYRFTYNAPQNVAGRRVAISDGIGYAYWTAKPGSGDFIYYPVGIGYLMPLIRITALLQNLSSLEAVSAQEGTWAGRSAQVLQVTPTLGDTEEEAPWCGQVWLDSERGFPLRYELTGPDWKEIYEVGLVNRDRDGQLVEFTLSGVGQPSGDQLVAVFSREGDGLWFPTFIRLISGQTTVEQRLTDVSWDQSFGREDIEVPPLQEMRVHLRSAERARAEADFPQMAADFEQVVRLDPYNVAAYVDLGYAFLVLGNDVKAEAHLQQALMLDPQLTVAYNNLAYLYIERNVYISRAVSLAEKAVSLEGDNPAYLDTLGWGYYSQGRYLEAVRLLKRALEVGEGQMDGESLVEIYYHLALAYKATGAEALAQNTIEVGLALGHEDSVYTEKLQQLLED